MPTRPGSCAGATRPWRGCPLSHATSVSLKAEPCGPGAPWVPGALSVGHGSNGTRQATGAHVSVTARGHGVPSATVDISTALPRPRPPRVGHRPRAEDSLASLLGVTYGPFLPICHQLRDRGRDCPTRTAPFPGLHSLVLISKELHRLLCRKPLPGAALVAAASVLAAVRTGAWEPHFLAPPRSPACALVLGSQARCCPRAGRGLGPAPCLWGIGEASGTGSFVGGPPGAAQGWSPHTLGLRVAGARRGRGHSRRDPGRAASRPGTVPPSAGPQAAPSSVLTSLPPVP